MSTEWRFRCVSHDPPMYGYRDDMGSPSKYDMAEALRLRDQIAAITEGVWEAYQYDLPSHVRWVHSHPNCGLELVSEYDEVDYRIEGKG